MRNHWCSRNRSPTPLIRSILSRGLTTNALPKLDSERYSHIYFSSWILTKLGIKDVVRDWYIKPESYIGSQSAINDDDKNIMITVEGGTEIQVQHPLSIEIYSILFAIRFMQRSQ